MSIDKYQYSTLVFERLSEVLKCNNLEELAHHLGINYGTLRNQKSRGKIPYTQIVSLLSGNNLLYVLKGYTDDIQSGESSRIRFFNNIKASAGDGVINDSESSSYLSFDSGIIKGSLGLSERNLIAITVDGDSMYPDLKEGDIALVDLSKKDIKLKYIYLIRIEGMLYIKRIQLLPQQKIQLISSNQHYPPVILHSYEIDNSFEIIGTVVYSNRMLI